MKPVRLTALAFALAAAFAALPAHADGSSLAVSLAVGWDGAAQPGAWIPYQVQVDNSSATQSFKGSVSIRAVPPNGAPAGGQAAVGPAYQQPVTVGPGGRRDLTIFGAYLDANSGVAGYVAELQTVTGAVVARSPVAGIAGGRLAVGLLSDTQAVAGQVKDTSLLSGVPGVVQLSHADLPGSPAELGGLSALVVENFDTSTLSQAQDQAVEQYVALGGNLVLAAGTGWRRTLGQVPPELLPLKPQGLVLASLDRLLDLQARHSALSAPSVAGAVAAGARTVLADAAGDPLLVELGYGAGRVLEITFDPAEEPVASHAEEARAAWAAALGRVPAPQVEAGRSGSSPIVLAPTSSRGFQLPAAALDDALAGLLNDTPANALPPLGLLGGLLVLYVLLAGPANYVLLRGLRRRELAWVTVPLVSLLFTGGAYAGGVLVHGHDYFVNEIQLLRLTPAGAIDAASYDAVFSPGRGDVAIQLGGASLASTVLSTASGFSDAGDEAVVGPAGTLVDLRNLAIWTPRDLKTEAPARAPIQVEAHLGLAGSRITGTVVNRSRSALRRLRLTTTDGRVANLVALLPAGATATVSAPLQAPPPSATPCGLGQCPSAAGGDRAAAVETVAAAAVVSPEEQVQALTGLADAVPGFLVNGAAPSRSVIAAFVLPVRLEFADNLPRDWSAPRLVAGNGLAGNPVSVIDYELPPMAAGAPLELTLGSAGTISSTNGAGAPTVQLFDWATGGWTPTDLSHPFLLSAGQRGPGVVRLRVAGSLFLQGLQVVTPGGGAR